MWPTKGASLHRANQATSNGSDMERRVLLAGVCIGLRTPTSPCSPHLWPISTFQIKLDTSNYAEHYSVLSQEPLAQKKNWIKLDCSNKTQNFSNGGEIFENQNKQKLRASVKFLFLLGIFDVIETHTLPNSLYEYKKFIDRYLQGVS